MTVNRCGHRIRAAAAWIVAAPGALAAQAGPPPSDTLRPVLLEAIPVSATRVEAPLARTPHAITILHKDRARGGRPAWGLDDVLRGVPGVFVANRHNFSVDQRLSIRGFGARSAFAVRGVKVLMDGIPLTLPDGQGQLTTVELAAVDRIEVLRGPSSALFGNASGGVITLTTDVAGPAPAFEGRVLGGAFDRGAERVWTKWDAATRFALGAARARVAVSRLAYAGERDHATADLRTLNARAVVPLSGSWTLTLLADGGDTPRADNPGALTIAELRADRDSAAALNVLRRAGKAVRQLQGGVAVRGRAAGTDVALSAFGITRDLDNPLPQAWISLERVASGARVSATRSWSPAGGRRELRVTAGVDLQWQRDDRREYAYLVPNAALATPDNTPDSLTRNQRERVVEVGPFVQALVTLSPVVSVTGGLRHDRVRFAVQDRHLSDGADNTGARVFAASSGTIGLAVSPAAGLTVYGNVASSFETPTTTELNNQPPPGGGGFNPDLEPQRAVSVEVGGRGQLLGGAAGSGLAWSAAVYEAAVRDELIAFEDTLVPGRRYFRNAASARHRGVELGARAALGSVLDVSGAWTFSDFRYRAHQLGAAILDGREIPGVPRHALRFAAIATPPGVTGLWTAVDATYASGYFVDDTLTTRTEPWWQVDIRVGWGGRVGAWWLRPFVGIDNVFNRHYVSSVVINAARGRYYEPAPGRSAYIGMQVTTSRTGVEDRRREDR
jgi:iron complex outermembrane receptor protein